MPRYFVEISIMKKIIFIIILAYYTVLCAIWYDIYYNHPYDIALKTQIELHACGFSSNTCFQYNTLIQYPYILYIPLHYNLLILLWTIIYYTNCLSDCVMCSFICLYSNWVISKHSILQRNALYFASVLLLVDQAVASLTATISFIICNNKTIWL